MIDWSVWIYYPFSFVKFIFKLVESYIWYGMGILSQGCLALPKASLPDHPGPVAAFPAGQEALLCIPPRGFFVLSLPRVSETSIVYSRT